LPENVVLHIHGNRRCRIVVREAKLLKVGLTLNPHKPNASDDTVATNL
jgi:hypothetical protein